jgi:hypothetical protein
MITETLKNRKVNFLPVHFTKTKISEIDYIDKDLEIWIKNKLKGRYCILKIAAISDNSKLKSIPIVAFENPEEMTYFILSYKFERT